MTVRDTLRNAVQELREAGGSDDACARWLLLHATGWSMTELPLRMDECMPSEVKTRMDALLVRCKAGEPVQYITGTWNFYGREFVTDARALVPRPETEILVQQALRLMAGISAPKVCDLGCGTGCIGLSIAAERPDAQVTLVDISADALELARVNANRLGLSVTFLQHDFHDVMPCGPYDMLLSNPPYIATQTCESLDRVVQHEPRLALDGGMDGLTAYRALAKRMADGLVPNGWIVLEVGMGQAEDVCQILRHDCDDCRIIPDWAGISRIVAVRKATYGGD